VTYVNDLSCI